MFVGATKQIYIDNCVKEVLDLIKHMLSIDKMLSLVDTKSFNFLIHRSGGFDLLESL